MKNLLLITLLLNTQLVFADGIADVIAGKSYTYVGGNGVTYIDTFNKDCTEMAVIEDGVKGKIIHIKCGDTVAFENEGKSIVYSLDGLRVRKDVDLGFKDLVFYPKEVPNPK